jgi:hypothetical protein
MRLAAGGTAHQPVAPHESPTTLETMEVGAEGRGC